MTDACLNQRSAKICQRLSTESERLGVRRHQLDCGSIVWDFGVEATGGLYAGLELARICTANLADIQLTPQNIGDNRVPAVSIYLDTPWMACMAAQYAGWKIQQDDFFAMGSGPMRSLARAEPLFEKLDYRERADAAVGVLETRQFPGDSVAQQIARQCGVADAELTLCVAPTGSLAGCLQIVARSVETALHKLYELDFDIRSIHAAYGIAPLPPVGRDDLQAIGRTNDAILYGADVTLWVDAADATLQQVYTAVPSDASTDYGAPFGETFARYDHDFYRIDAALFSPARVHLTSIRTGNTFAAGRLREDILSASFY